MEKIDMGDLVLERERRSQRTRGHSRIVEKNQFVRDIRKYSFPHRVVDAWNGLSEGVVTAANVHTFKERLDKCRYGDRTP